MKRIASIVAVVLLAISLTGCSALVVHRYYSPTSRTGETKKILKKADVCWEPVVGFATSILFRQCGIELEVSADDILDETGISFGPCIFPVIPAWWMGGKDYFNGTITITFVFNGVTNKFDLNPENLPISLDKGMEIFPRWIGRLQDGTFMPLGMKGKMQGEKIGRLQDGTFMAEYVLAADHAPGFFDLKIKGCSIGRQECSFPLIRFKKRGMLSFGM